MDKALKKAIIRERNKRRFIILMLIRDMELAQEGLAAPRHDFDLQREKLKQRQKKNLERNMSWSEKAVLIQNRLDDKRRKTQERWNRFAGTAESGGRGL